MRFFGFVALLSLSALSSAPAPAAELRVLSLNVFAGTEQGMDFGRLQRQIEAVKALDPDVLCLQETFDPEAVAKYREAFPGHHAYVSGQSSDEGMKGMARALLKFKGLDAVKGLNDIIDGDRFGLMLLLRKDKGEVSAPSAVAFTDQVARGFLAAKFEQLKPHGYLAATYTVGKTPIRVLNAWMSNGEVTPDKKQVVNVDRIKQVHQVAKETSGEMPSILCGDTNADGEQPEMKWLRGAGKMKDTFTDANRDLSQVLHKGMTWSADNPNTKGELDEPDQRVDYVLTRSTAKGRFTTVSSQLVLDEKPEVSDHYGILSTLRFE